MKELLSLMASYNQETNQQLFEILNSLEQDKLRKETGSYFNSILGLINHILLANLNWLCRFRESEDIESVEFQNTILDYHNPGRGKNLYNDLKSVIDHQQAIDDLFIELINNTENSMFEKQVWLFGSSGHGKLVPYGKCMMHVFNHQTHHRGAISQILDESALENDYSNLAHMFIERK
jgi:uncharacterized damage-inducible protein DinB